MCKIDNISMFHPSGFGNIFSLALRQLLSIFTKMSLTPYRYFAVSDRGKTMHEWSLMTSFLLLNTLAIHHNVVVNRKQHL